MLQLDPFAAFGFFFVFVLFSIVVVIIIIVAVVRGAAWKGNIQRPLSTATSFPPPPPPDTVMVRCAYCGTQQTWKETCIQCGAPLPKPQMP